MPETENNLQTGADQNTPQLEKAKPKVWIPNNRLSCRQQQNERRKVGTTVV